MLLSSPMLINLRPINESDMLFLSQLYASTRAAELAVTGWSSAQKKFFLDSQFQLQHNHYQQQFAAGEFHIIEISKNAVGRLYYGWEGDDLRLIDIALLPQHQSKGIGRQLMQKLIALVKAKNGILSLHVDINNPARNWYLKLGFVPSDNSGALINGIYQKMLLRPN